MRASARLAWFPGRRLVNSWSDDLLHASGPASENAVGQVRYRAPPNGIRRGGPRSARLRSAAERRPQGGFRESRGQGSSGSEKGFQALHGVQIGEARMTRALQSTPD